VENLLTEERISLTQLAQELNVAAPTIWRWWRKGIREVKLETYLLGGRRQTSRAAVTRFIERTSASSDGERLVAKPQTNRQRRAAIRQAEQELDRAGI